MPYFHSLKNKLCLYPLAELDENVVGWGGRGAQPKMLTLSSANACTSLSGVASIIVLIWSLNDLAMHINQSKFL
jgi:hypothetical protein